MSNIEQKFINVDNFTLAYSEKNSKVQETIFFIHGNSATSRMWIYQFTSPLFDNYRLIAIDLPGHGKSSHSSNPKEDFSPVNTGKILADTVSILHNHNPFILVGSSYGTNVVAEMLNEEIAPSGIAFTGCCVIGDGAELGDLLVNPDNSIYFTDNISKQKARDFFSSLLKSTDTSSVDMYVEDFMNTKAPFRSTLLQTAMEGKVSDEITLLRKLDIPLLIVFGQNDNYLHINYLDKLQLPKWNNRIYKLEDSGHFVQTDTPIAFNELLLEYAKEQFKSTHS